MNQIIDKETLAIHKEADAIFKAMQRLEMLTLNVSIIMAKLNHIPDARALGEAGKIINEGLIKLEDSTRRIKDSAKYIADVNKEEK